jgi:hypothetical protein
MANFKANIIFCLIVIVYCIYGAIFIYQTSLLINSQRYFCLLDDAMISMRYAKNFASGQGLVWNPGGEKVEGYTNLLWTLYMSGCHFFPIPDSKMSLCIQISGLLFLAFNLLFVRKIADYLSEGSNLVSLSAVCLTAFFYPLNNAGLRGMEVCLLTLLISTSTWVILDSWKNKKFPVIIYPLLTVLLLTRLDTIIICFIFWFFLLATDKENYKKHLRWGLFFLGLGLIPQTIFRFFYYGDWLPNTYYLKMTGGPFTLRIAHGIYVFAKNFLLERGLVLFFIPLVLLFFQPNPQIFLLLLLIFGQIFYSIYVGGDAWETFLESNRFIAIVMPPFFVLLVLTFYKIISIFSENSFRKFFYLMAIGATIIIFNASINLRYLKNWLLLEEPLQKNILHRNWLTVALILKDLTTPQARITVSASGTTAYFLPDRNFIDILGKCDRYIARLKMRRPPDPLRDFFPGHMKWDYFYSIVLPQPDVVVVFSLPVKSGEDEKFFSNYFMREYLFPDFNKKIEPERVFFKRGSPNILWNKKLTAI